MKYNLFLSAILPLTLTVFLLACKTEVPKA